MTKEVDDKYLELYSDSEYDKPSVTVDAIIFRINNIESDNYRKLPEKKLQVFLNKRNNPPFSDYYSAIGTFIDLKTELNETMKLCVKNKVGLENYYYEQLFTFGEKSRDPRTRVLSVSYMLLTNKDETPNNGEWFDVDIKETKTSVVENKNGFTLSKNIELILSNQNHTLKNTLLVVNEKQNLQETKSTTLVESALAFDHAKIIYYAYERLKNKLEYTDIVFNLLPKHFTLTELKQVYEEILKTPLLDANFRRKTSKMVTPTNSYVEGKGHRTSQLFTHNPNWTLNNLD